jgi:hypothetical protein
LKKKTPIHLSLLSLSPHAQDRNDQTRRRMRAAALGRRANNHGRLVGSSCSVVPSSSSTPANATATALPMVSKGPVGGAIGAPSSPPQHTDAILDVGHHHLSWQMSDVGMSARPPKRQTCNVGADMLATCHLTCRQHGAKTCCRGCRHDTRHVGFSDMSATCRGLHLRTFVVDNFVIVLTIAY